MHLSECFHILCENQNTRSLFIKSVNEFQKTGSVQAKLLNHADPLSGASVDSNSRRLVNDQEILILKKEVRLKAMIANFSGGIC